MIISALWKEKDTGNNVHILIDHCQLESVVLEYVPSKCVKVRLGHGDL